MNCAFCKKSIGSNSYISFANQEFCSDVCQLKFYKEEMPNLGGSAISDEDIVKVERSSGDERRQLIDNIFTRTMSALESGKFMQAISNEAEKDTPINL